MWGNDEILTLVNDALSRHETVVLGCACEVKYIGRAESFLSRGDRIILVKEDQSLLVHQPTGNLAVNYMKPGGSNRLSINDGKLILKSSNILQKEEMEINIFHVHFFNSHKLNDGQSIIVAGTEEDMSNMLYAQPSLIEEGFTPVSREEQTKYGFIDVFGYDRNGMLTIVECKRFTADLSAVTQLRRYVEKVKESKGISAVRGIIASPKITENAKKMLTDWGFTHVAVQPPKYHELYNKKQLRLDGF